MTVFAALDVIGLLCLVDVELIAAIAEFIIAFGGFVLGPVEFMLGVAVGVET